MTLLMLMDRYFAKEFTNLIPVVWIAHVQTCERSYVCVCHVRAGPSNRFKAFVYRLMHCCLRALPNGWELTCGARFGPRLQLRFCRWLMKPQNRLALDPKSTFSLQKTRRGAPSG